MLDSAFINILNALNKLNNLSPAYSIVEKLEIKWPYPGPQGRHLLIISRKLARRFFQKKIHAFHQATSDG